MSAFPSPPLLAFRPDPDASSWGLAALMARLLRDLKPQRCAGAGTAFAMARALAAADGLSTLFADLPAADPDETYDLVILSRPPQDSHLAQLWRDWRGPLAPGGMLLIQGAPAVPQALGVAEAQVRHLSVAGGLTLLRPAPSDALADLWSLGDADLAALAAQAELAGERWIAAQKLHEAEAEIRRLRRRLREEGPKGESPADAAPAAETPVATDLAAMAPVRISPPGAAAPARATPWRAAAASAAFAASWLTHAGTRRRAKKERRLRRRITELGLFDAGWYVSRYLDADPSGLDPLTHFLRVGMAAGYDPSPDFDGGWYLKAYPDIKAAGYHAIEHFALYGAAEGRPHRRLVKQRPPVTPPPPEQRLGLHLSETTIFPVTIGMVVPWDLSLEALRQAVLAAGAALERIEQAVSGRILVLGLGERLDPSLLADTPAVIVPNRRDAHAAGAHNRLMEIAFGCGAEVYVAVSVHGRLDPLALAALMRTVRANGRAALAGAALVAPQAKDQAAPPASWLGGHCLAIPKAVRDRIGGFDPQFPSYCADMDYSWRAALDGVPALLCPPARFVDTGIRTAADEAREAYDRLAMKWQIRATGTPAPGLTGAAGSPAPMPAADATGVDPARLRRPW